MKLHHVGVVVRDLASYGAEYSATLGLEADSEIVFDPIQKVRIQFWRDGESNVTLELIEPASPDSPVARALTKGGGLNHLCYEVDDLAAAVNRCVAGGAVLAGGLSPAVAFGGRRVAFLFFARLKLIELVERTLPGPGGPRGGEHG